MGRKNRYEMWLAFVGYGYLAAAEWVKNLPGSPEDYYRDLVDKEDVVFVLAHIPSDIAEKVALQGTSDQWYGDGYEAAAAMAPYVREAGSDRVGCNPRFSLFPRTSYKKARQKPVVEAVEIKKATTGSPALYEVKRDGVLLGFLEKYLDTRDETHPWKARRPAFVAGHRPIVGELVGFFYAKDGGKDAAVAALESIKRMNPVFSTKIGPTGQTWKKSKPTKVDDLWRIKRHDGVLVGWYETKALAQRAIDTAPWLKNPIGSGVLPVSKAPGCIRDNVLRLQESGLFAGPELQKAETGWRTKPFREYKWVWHFGSEQRYDRWFKLLNDTLNDMGYRKIRYRIVSPDGKVVVNLGAREVGKQPDYILVTMTMVKAD